MSLPVVDESVQALLCDHILRLTVVVLPRLRACAHLGARFHHWLIRGRVGSDLLGRQLLEVGLEVGDTAAVVVE